MVGAIDGGVVGTSDGLVLGAMDGLEVGAFEGINVGHVSTAQKGPFCVEGAVLYVHPELVKMPFFVMNGIVVFQAHKFWLNLDALLNMLVILVTLPTSHLEMS